MKKIPSVLIVTRIAKIDKGGKKNLCLYTTFVKYGYFVGHVIQFFYKMKFFCASKNTPDPTRTKK